MNDPSVKKKPSDVLRMWADKIDKNAEEDFSGVFIVIPPEGEPTAGLFIDDQQSVGTFFAVLKTRVDEAIENINSAQRQHPNYR